MKFRKPSGKVIIILGSILLVFIIAVFIVNAYLARIIEGQIRSALNKNRTDYKIELSDVRFNIISGNLKIIDLTIKPDSSKLVELKEGNLPMQTMVGAEIPMFKIAGIGYYQAFFNKSFVVRKIELSEAHFIIYKGANQKSKTELPIEKQQFNADSIYIEKLGGIYLKKIIFSECQFDLYNLVKDDYLIKTGKVNAELTGMDLIEKKDQEHIFMLGFNDFKMEVSFEQFKLPGGWYNLGIGKLTYNMPDSSFRIRNLKYWPQYDDLNEMAKDQRYTKEIYNLSIKEIDLFHCYITSLIRDGSLFMDSAVINRLNIDMLKDKRYPFNELQRPKLPHQLLKTMELPLNIPLLRLKNSNLKYQEKNEGVKDLMTVTLDRLNAEIKNVTSVKDSINTGKVLEIHLIAKIMDKAAADIHLAMPLKSRSDTMFFTGYIGSAQMKHFNKATIPALDLKITAGRLNSVDFKGSANDHFSNGEMTMKYEGLASEVYKKETKKTNKFITWAANTAIHNNNPGRNGKLRIAHMEFDRVMYKGFGNFIWKTVQSGIMNTLAPTGKLERTENRDQKEDRPKSRRKRRKSKD